MAEILVEEKRVLLITNNLPPVRGGSGIVYDALARAGAGRIAVIASKRSYQDGLPLIGWREHDRLAPYPVVRLGLLRTVIEQTEPRRLKRLRFLARDSAIRIGLLIALIRQLVRDRISVVCIGELIASAWILNVLRLFPSIIRVVYVHGEEITTEDDYDATKQRRRSALMAAHHIVVVSRFTAAAVRDLLGPAADSRVRLIENGVDVDRFRPAERRGDLIARYGLGDSFVFVSVCRLLEKKGIDHTIQAFARVLEDFPDSRFLVVGDGPYRRKLESLAEDVGVAAKVVFTGSVADDELVDHYAMGHVFVMPNRKLPNGDTEGFGLVFLEANACGLPVIAGRDGGSKDAVTHGVNGLLVDGNSLDDITSAMLHLRTDPTMCDQLRKGGYAAAAAADWRHKARAFLALFDAKP